MEQIKVSMRSSPHRATVHRTVAFRFSSPALPEGRKRPTPKGVGLFLAGAQGLELPLIQYFTSRNAVFSPLSSEIFTIL